MSKRFLDYLRRGTAKSTFSYPRPMRSAAAVVTGVLIATYCGFGAAFVGGAVEHGDPSADRATVWILLFFGCAGILLAVFGFFGKTEPKRIQRDADLNDKDASSP
jgi:hypothetical protein